MSDPRILLALDFHDERQCLSLIDQLDPKLCRLKIGKEMFTLFGPQLVERIHTLGFDVFLDLKFHDIPNTVAKAVASAADLGVWMVNVHAMGGERMMSAAVEALAGYENKPKLIAVTVLTSMGQEDLSGIGIDVTPKEHAERLAQLAVHSGIDGVVCSAQEVADIKSACGDGFLCVTPGIRPLGNDTQDQKRVMTPTQAIKEGSDYLVVGRPITQADNPAQALVDIAAEVACA